MKDRENKPAPRYFRHRLWDESHYVIYRNDDEIIYYSYNVPDNLAHNSNKSWGALETILECEDIVEFVPQNTSNCFIYSHEDL